MRKLLKVVLATFTFLLFFYSSQQSPDLPQHLRALGVERGDFIHNLLRATVIHNFAAVGVLDGEVEGLLVNRSSFYAPALGRVGERLLQLDKLLQVVVVERVRLAEAPAGVELVVLNLPCRCALIEEKHHRLNARTLEHATRAVEDCVEIGALQQ